MVSGADVDGVGDLTRRALQGHEQAVDRRDVGGLGQRACALELRDERVEVRSHAARHVGRRSEEPQRREAHRHDACHLHGVAAQLPNGKLVGVHALRRVAPSDAADELDGDADHPRDRGLVQLRALPYGRRQHQVGSLEQQASAGSCGAAHQGAPAATPHTPPRRRARRAPASPVYVLVRQSCLSSTLTRTSAIGIVYARWSCTRPMVRRYALRSSEPRGEHDRLADPAVRGIRPGRRGRAVARVRAGGPAERPREGHPIASCTSGAICSSSACWALASWGR